MRWWRRIGEWKRQSWGSRRLSALHLALGSAHSAPGAQAKAQ